MYVYKSKNKLKTDKNVKFSLVFISDIHYCKDYNLKRFELIFNEIKKIKPDYICIPGDIVDDNSVTYLKCIDKLYHFLEKLGTITKVFITLGNHDLLKDVNDSYVKHYPFNFVNKLKKLKNVYLLEDELYQDNNVCFIGYNPSYEYYNTKELDFSLFEDKFDISKFKLKKSNYNILLLHSPIGIMAFKNNIVDNFDLILSGHTHGGMLPSWMFGHRGLISPSKILFPHDMRGHKRINNTDIIISSGIMKLSKKSKLTIFNDLYAMDINIVKIN